LLFDDVEAGRGEAHRQAHPATELFVREHRLYQVDFLLRRYGFTDAEIVFGEGGQLSLDADPKEVWARHHPEAFPVDVNRASKNELLRVPGLGPITVKRLLERRAAGRLNRIDDVGKVGKQLLKAKAYLSF
ncbi:MAG: helix-hairpin-helix domain-containing protein, partial [Phycisphaerae bacterium]|nr:helix-hairpin-helix domain-containing protein [Phycisphaerae bacterium]